MGAPPRRSDLEVKYENLSRGRRYGENILENLSRFNQCCFLSLFVSSTLQRCLFCRWCSFVVRRMTKEFSIGRSRGVPRVLTANRWPVVVVAYEEPFESKPTPNDYRYFAVS